MKTDAIYDAAAALSAWECPRLAGLMKTLGAPRTFGQSLKPLSRRTGLAKRCAFGFLLGVLVCAGPMVVRAASVTAPIVGTAEVSDDAAIESTTVLSPLGEACAASQNGRLKLLPGFDNARLIRIFDPAARAANKKLDWGGEHAGKWLYAAALCARRTGDRDLKMLVLKTADELIATQEDDGYLGTYSTAQRFTNDKSARHMWSWDVWNASLMALGLLEVNRQFPDEKYLGAAKKMGELFLRSFADGKHDVTGYGTRKGIHATVLLDPALELYTVTGDRRYLELALLIVREIEAKDGLRIVSESLKKSDLETMADGKVYGLLWNFAAIVKLYGVTGKPDLLTAVTNTWQNVVEFHLTLGGGPWGGIGKHYECFNRRGFWSPYGYVETCSIMAWIQLNRQLLKVTGEAKYAQEIETAAFNALLGATYPDGKVSCYHTFENGRRHLPNFTHCCSSSAALALEEVVRSIYSRRGQGIACNLYTGSEATIKLSATNSVRIAQMTDYPLAGKIQITVFPDQEARFPIFLRIPNWAKSADIQLNGQTFGGGNLTNGIFLPVEKIWKTGDRIEIEFPMELKVHRRQEHAIVPQSDQDIYCIRWFAVTRGPLVYATDGLIQGQEREGVFRIPERDSEAAFTQVATPPGSHGPAYELRTTNRKPPLLLPYYEAGGRTTGAWRLTWLQEDIE